MASISIRPNGLKWLQFTAADGSRKTLRLGQINLRQAQTIKTRIESLIASKAFEAPPADEVARWLCEIEDRMHARLVAVGLVDERQSTELGAFLTKYLGGLSIKPESLRKLKQTEAKLVAFFGGKIALRAITEDQAADWRQSLAKVGLSIAAVKIHCGNAKTIFNEAKRRGLIQESAFRWLASGCTRSAESRYITPDECDAIIQALPDAQWRLLFGLARLAGLRIPSESSLLRWADVDWARGRLNVRSPKTERHPGHERRFVPITPKLFKLLQDRFDEAPEGEERLVTMRGAGNVRKIIGAAIKRAGIEPWDKLFQSCRSSCEKEWAMIFPQYAVSKWVGHSIAVSGRHYANDVPDELFDKATLKAKQQAAEVPGNGKQMKKPSEEGFLHNPAMGRDLTQVIAGQGLGGGGNRTPVPR